MEHGYKSRLYSAWANMKSRVKNPKPQDRAAGLEISYCSEWEKYAPFREWALQNGYDDSLTLDRRDTYGNYEPSNCRWITQKEQARNTTRNKYVEYKGETKCLVEWAELLGFEFHTLKSRLLRGWSIERAFTEPLGIGRRDAMYIRERDEKGRMK
jgi:hypothetical protein